MAALAENRVLVRERDDSAKPVCEQSPNNGIVPEWVAETQTLIGCGPPSAANRILIVDPVSCVACPPDGVGEIWVFGPTVAQGYWNRPQESKETFGATLADTGEGPFMRTGDLGFWRDGNLYVTGRIKDVIIQKGVNIYPHDLEHTVERCHPAMRPGRGAAFSVEVGDHERVVVLQEVERSYVRAIDVDEVVGAIRRSVFAEHDVSVHAVVLIRPASILKTSSGKIQRRACKQAYLNDELKVVAQWKADEETIGTSVLFEELCDLSPLDRAERLTSYLRDVLSEHLACAPEEIGHRDRLVELGIESTSAVEISIQLHEELGPAVTSTVIFDYPTLEALADYLDGELFPEVESEPATETVRRQLSDLAPDDIAELLAEELS